jgi:hypothetical protein
MLGRLGSPYDGERAAAGLLLDRFLRERGLVWDDVVAPPAPLESEEDSWRADATEAARYPGLLNPWERNFLRALVGFAEISEKQRQALQRIVAKVRGR